MDSTKICPSVGPLSDSDLARNEPVRPESPEKPALLAEDGLMSPPPRPNGTTPRPLSLISRPGSRLSLSLPVQILDRDVADSYRQGRNSSELSTGQASPSRDGLPPASPSTPSSFLVALAAQERKVFELKEELHKAEAELKKLKRQWTLNEANQNTAKWKAEAKTLEMQPMQAVMANADADNGIRIPGGVAGRGINLDRRRATIDENARDSRRKIITGGHTRTLSLLSPTQKNLDKAAPSQPPPVAMHSMAGSVSTPANLRLGRRDLSKARHSYQDSATNGVKQIAEDIKSGLWTFMEDLRQATVGDEAVKGPPTRDEKVSNDLRRMASKRSPEVVNQETNVEEGQTSANHETSDKSPDRKKLQAEESAETANSVDDKWSDWDSPISQAESVRWSDSTNSSYNVNGSASGLDSNFKTTSHQTVTTAMSPTTELKTNTPSTPANISSADRDEISWPSLNNFTPGNIKRTASAIIKEWEKTMSPTLEQRDTASSNRNEPKTEIAEEGESRLPNNLS